MLGYGKSSVWVGRKLVSVDPVIWANLVSAPDTKCQELAVASRSEMI